MMERPSLGDGFSQGSVGRMVTHSFHKHLLDTYFVSGSGAELLMVGKTGSGQDKSEIYGMSCGDKMVITFKEKRNEWSI